MMLQFFLCLMVMAVRVTLPVFFRILTKHTALYKHYNKFNNVDSSIKISILGFVDGFVAAIIF